MRFTCNVTILFIMMSHRCCQARELALYRVDEGPTEEAASAPKRRVNDTAQAAVFGDTSTAEPQPPRALDTRETYRSEEARLRKERREMFFRNLGVHLDGSTSMSLGKNAMSLSFSMGNIIGGAFGSEEEEDDGEQDQNNSADGDLLPTTRDGASILDMAKQELLGLKIDIPLLKAKALDYANERREEAVLSDNIGEGSLGDSNVVRWAKRESSYDDMKTKTLVYAAERKNDEATRIKGVLVRRRILWSEGAPPDESTSLQTQQSQ